MPRGTMSTTRMRKVQCPWCGVICRMSRTAMSKSGLPWCGCGTRMTCPDLEDLAVVAPDDDRLREVEHAIEEYAKRSEEQQNRWGKRGNQVPAGQRREVALERAAAAVTTRMAGAPAWAGGDDIPF